MPRAQQKIKPVEEVKEVKDDLLPEEQPTEETGPTEEELKKNGVFGLVVEWFSGKLPGVDADYDAEKDHLLLGFKYGSSTTPSWVGKDVLLKEISTYDFLTNPLTGLRAGQKVPPHGSQTVDLTKGISKWDDIPPYAIWKRGNWLSEIIFKPGFDDDELPVNLRNKVEDALKNWPKSGTPATIYPYWVVSGEGTMGNNIYRIYELPKDIASDPKPKHPLMWREDLRRDKGTGTYGFNNGYLWKGEAAGDWYYNGQSGGTQTGASKPPAAKAPALPAGVRMRCPGCGHWFAMSDLPGHNQVCGKGEEADWALMCDVRCGCETLDDVAKPKPGFPKVIAKKEEEKPDGEVVEVSGSGDAPSKS
jgi:hypothetical protein